MTQFQQSGQSQYENIGHPLQKLAVQLHICSLDVVNKKPSEYVHKITEINYGILNYAIKHGINYLFCYVLYKKITIAK